MPQPSLPRCPPRRLPRGAQPETKRAGSRNDRRLLGEGLVSWVYEYGSVEDKVHSGMASGLEIGVQLTGEWLLGGSRQKAAVYGPGQIHRVNIGEGFRYRYRADAPKRPLRQVGFIVYPQRSPRFADTGGELYFPGDAGVRDERLHELALHFADRVERDPAQTLRDAERELCRYVWRHCAVAPPDGLVVAKQQIDRAPEAELYVRHLAEIAHMHPETFSRAFKRRFGMTPIAYRLKTRLNLASHLGWSRPDLSIAEIAQRAGFHDQAFFHREFLRLFGVTPTAHARRRQSAG